VLCQETSKERDVEPFRIRHASIHIRDRDNASARPVRHNSMKVAVTPSRSSASMPRTSRPAENNPACPVNTTAAALFAACKAVWIARSSPASSALTGGRFIRSSRMNAACPLGDGGISWSVASIMASP
jgi:hypothetical protein